MKIGILTYHRARNYGAFLQAYALCECLNKEEGIDAELIDFRMKKELLHYTVQLNRRYIKHIRRFFHDKNDAVKQQKLFDRDSFYQKKSIESCVSDEITDFYRMIEGKYDLILVGSDEVWKTDGFRGFPNPYWLTGNIEVGKAAYAVSARNDFSKLSEKNRTVLVDALNSFGFIGVRDSITREEVIKYCADSQEVYLCCDPVFLYEFVPDVVNGKEILKNRFHIDETKKIVGLMTENEKISKKIRKCLNKNEFEILSLYQWQPGCINGSQLSPFEWLDVMACLDILLTSYFHAVCFAAKFGVPFIAFATQGKESKVKELIFQMKRERDYVINIEELLGHKELLKKVYERVGKVCQPYVPEKNMMDGYMKLLSYIKSEE